MGVHRFAAATALATFALLVVGGLVSTTESGLACPDWPLCEGEFIPPMIDGKEYEHSHRLVAAFVGAMTLGLSALLFKHRRHDRLLVGLGAAAAVLVIVQALLGAATVWLKLPWWVSSTHLATAMLFFALAVSLAFLTRHRLAPPPPPRLRAEQARLARAVLPALALVYLQVAVGGAMRHLRGGLACGFDFPFCLGELWPLDGHLGVQVHMIHRTLGLAATFATVALWLWLRRQESAPRPLKLVSLAAAALALSQATLGILTVLLSREMLAMTLHSAGAAALLGLLTGAYWLARPSHAPAASEAREREPALEVA